MFISSGTRNARNSRTPAQAAPHDQRQQQQPHSQQQQQQPSPQPQQQQQRQQQQPPRSDVGRHNNNNEYAPHPQHNAPTHGHGLGSIAHPSAPMPSLDNRTSRPPQPTPLPEDRRRRIVCVDPATAGHAVIREPPNVRTQDAIDRHAHGATVQHVARSLSAIAYDDDESANNYTDDGDEFTDDYSDEDDVVEDDGGRGEKGKYRADAIKHDAMDDSDHDSTSGSDVDDEDEEEEEEDDAGSRVMQDAVQREAVLVLCRAWRNCRAELQAIGSPTKALRKERARVVNNIVSYMRGQNIERACGPIGRRRRIMVTLRPGRRSYSTTDQTLNDAIYRRASIKLADAYVVDPRRQSLSSSSSSSSSSRKRTLPDGASPAPRAKHHKSSTPSESSETGGNSDSSGGEEYDYESDGDTHNNKGGKQSNDHNGREEEEEDDDEAASNDDDNAADNGNEHGVVSLRDALARLVVRAIREAQNALTVDRHTVAVQVYDKASRYSYEPIAISQEEDQGKGKEKEGEQGDERSVEGAARPTDGPITIYPELPPVVARWAARLHEIDDALADIRKALAPVRARMAALTTDLAAPAVPRQDDQTTPTTTSATKTTKSKKSTGKTRAQAAEEKRLLHEAHAPLRNDVRAYLAAHPADANAPPGVAVQFASARPNVPPVAYRVRAVLRIRRGTVAVRDYERLAAEAAQAALAATGVDSDQPYSPTVADHVLSTDAARKALFDALKAAMDRHRNAHAREPVRALAITKISGSGRSSSGSNTKGDPPAKPDA